MSTPKRIQMTRQIPWRPENPDAVIVDRRTKWGNPFAYRTHTALVRFPAAVGDGPWEYEGRISADGASHPYHHADGRISFCEVRYMTHAEIVETFWRDLVGAPTPATRAGCPWRDLPPATATGRPSITGTCHMAQAVRDGRWPTLAGTDRNVQ